MDVAVHIMLATVSGAVEQRDLGVEPPDEDLLAGHALFRDDLQKRYGVTVIPLEHLAHDREEIPHALWLAASKWPKQRCPFGSGGWRSGAQVIDVAERRWRDKITSNRATEIGSVALTHETLV